MGTTLPDGGEDLRICLVSNNFDFLKKIRS